MVYPLRKRANSPPDRPAQNAAYGRFRGFQKVSEGFRAPPAPSESGRTSSLSLVTTRSCTSRSTPRAAGPEGPEGFSALRRAGPFFFLIAQNPPQPSATLRTRAARKAQTRAAGRSHDTLSSCALSLCGTYRPSIPSYASRISSPASRIQRTTRLPMLSVTARRPRSARGAVAPIGTLRGLAS